MNLAPLFNDCLKRRDIAPVGQKTFRVQDLDGFLKEAYTLNTHIAELTSYLRSIRAPYLSTTHQPRRKPNDTKHLTDADRNDIDAQAKRSIRELNARIQQLSEASHVAAATRSQISAAKRTRNGLGGLARWAAGGGMTAKSPEEAEEDARLEAQNMFRDGVILYLQQKLAEVARMQSGMMEIRITREVEKSKSVLYKARGMPPGLADANGSGAGANGYGSAQAKREYVEGNGTTGGGGDGGMVLTEEQMQLFAQENQDMLKHYEDTLDQVRSAERSLMEISELQTTLAQNLAEQTDQIDVLVQNSFQTVENVGSGNKELKRASERKSTARAAFWFTVGLCGFLITWDLLI